MTSMVDDISQKVNAVVARQAALCKARTESLEKELVRLTTAVEELSKQMAVAQTAIAVQRVKISGWTAASAAIGGALPVLYFIIKEWMGG